MSSLESERPEASSQPSRAARWTLNAIRAVALAIAALALAFLVFHAPFPTQLTWLLNFLASIALILLLPAGVILVRDLVRRELLDLRQWSVRLIVGAFTCSALSAAYLMEEQSIKPTWLPSALTAAMAALSLISLIALMFGAIWFAVEPRLAYRRK